MQALAGVKPLSINEITSKDRANHYHRLWNRMLKAADRLEPRRAAMVAIWWERAMRWKRLA